MDGRQKIRRHRTSADPDAPTPHPPKYHKNVGFLSNSGPDPLKNQLSPYVAFNDGPAASARQRNAI